MIEENKDLVFLTDATVRADLYTTDEVIAECSGNKRESIQRKIRDNKTRLEHFGKVNTLVPDLENGQDIRKPIKSTFSGGRHKKTYMLNEQQATFLVTLLGNTEQVLDFKENLVKQFFNMKQELLERDIRWENGKLISNRLNTAITNHYGKERATKEFRYSGFNDLVYRAVLGKSSKQLKEERGLTGVKNIASTQLLSTEEQKAIEPIKDKVASLLDLGIDYYAIKAIVTGNGVKELNAKYSKKKKTA